MRRCPTKLAVLTAALMLAGWTALVRADDITTYEITNTSNNPISLVEFTVSPEGSLVTGPPINTLPDTTFHTDPNTDPSTSATEPFLPLQTLVGTPSDPSVNLNLLAIAFAGDSTQGFSTRPLEPGEMFHFSLNLAAGQATPTVALYQPVAGDPYQVPAGLTFQVIPPTSTDNGGSNTPTPPAPTETPEPLSVILWSTLAGAGLLRARKLRRTTPAPRSL